MNRRLPHTPATSDRTGGDDRPAPACKLEDAPLFGSIDLADHMAAARICAGCPMVQACIEKAIKIADEQTHSNPMYRGPDGTWGGLLWRRGEILDPNNMPRIHRRKDAA